MEDHTYTSVNKVRVREEYSGGLNKMNPTYCTFKFIDRLTGLDYFLQARNFVKWQITALLVLNFYVT